MTQFHWDLIGYGVWTLIIWMTVKQFLQTRSPVKGKGLRLLLGDWLLFAPVPWIVYCVGSRGTLEDVGWVLGLGIVAALPYILTTKFISLPTGEIQFKRNILFLVFLFGLPYVRYLIRTEIFQSHPIFFEGTYKPDIELMLALYISILVILTFVWRLFMYLKFKQLKSAILKEEEALNEPEEV